MLLITLLSIWWQVWGLSEHMEHGFPFGAVEPVPALLNIYFDNIYIL